MIGPDSLNEEIRLALTLLFNFHAMSAYLHIKSILSLCWRNNDQNCGC